MNKTRHLTGRIEFLLCTGLLGAMTACVSAQPGPPGVEASVSVGLPGVEIRAESDFYQPLTPYGQWEVIGSYGRCWRPGRVEAGWRPYCTGYWQRTDAGWYWASDEPWAWATYHYGRWDFTDQYGWYWVPQIQWAPAWVSWHEGGGYIGWAPLYPSARFARGGSVEVDVSVISPRAYVFVEERHFLEPVRPSTVAANNTTIINKTVNITNVKVVNNTVFNEGPATAVVEKASGRKVQPVAVRELRHKEEAAVVAKQPAPASVAEKKIQAPVRSEVEPRAKNAVAAPAPSQVEKPGVTPRAPAPLTPTGRVRDSGNAKPIPAQAEPRYQTTRPAAVKEPAAPKAPKYTPLPEQPARKSETKAPGKPMPPAGEKPVASEKNGRAAGDQGQHQKAEQHPAPPEKPAGPPSFQ